VKLGIFLNTQFTPGTDVAAHLAALVEQVRVARESGFSSLFLPHHYLTSPMQMLQPVPLLAYLAREAEGMAIGCNILILPLLDPVHVAEESATLDLLSGGRFIMGVGLGYRAAEFDGFGVPLRERVPRFCESIEVMRRLWREDKVTYHGRTLRLVDQGISLKPARPEGPPIWIAAIVDAAVKRAARLGDGWLIVNAATMAELEPQMALYRDTLRDCGKPVPEELPIARECHIGASREAALAECRGPLEYKYGAYASWGLDSEAPQEGPRSFEALGHDRFLIGDKSYVRDEIARYEGTLGVNHFIMRVQWPGLPQHQVLNTIRSLGEIAAA
jgi:alkanesulfonate monooxygenase SsuD/methylene tetrahydromethanopterin reductase-like flavin-dependent oxidoreductase (luciferase family)